MIEKDLLELRIQSMGSSPLFYKEPVHLVKGEGIWLYDDSDNKYMDCYNNVPCVGHCHPHVIEALSKQAGQLNTHSRYLSKVVVDYSERLMSLHADPLSVLQMGCSGTEAIEIAIKMARLATGGKGIICSNATYHGNSHETIRMTIGPFEPDFKRVPFPEKFRPLKEGLAENELCDLYLDEIKRAISEFSENNIPLAGMLFCSIFANEGLPEIPSGFMQKAAKLVRDAGGVVILDEVQAGFCRTGSWWGYEVNECVPDIVAMGKPMGSGYPLSGVGTSPEIAKIFHEKSYYFNTTASTPLQAAVGSAVLDVIEEEDLLGNVNSVGEYLKDKVKGFAKKYDMVGDVRGLGLFVAIECIEGQENKNPNNKLAVEFVEKMKQKGFLISNAGQFRNVLKIRPPLVFEKDHADSLCEVLEETLEEVHN
ncbi:MAG TPA: aspartate aminotransferase family protein [Gammaproteobacteria bacterium]|jgi:4-aminobutyrate aminotransferase-like enzyme|nr:aspartate aminotransferase family protein [Gammaproteobacteria bacterium]